MRSDFGVALTCWEFPLLFCAFSLCLHYFTMRKDQSEVSCCVKYLLFFFNVFFWVSLFLHIRTISCHLASWQFVDTQCLKKARNDTTPSTDFFCLFFPFILEESSLYFESQTGLLSLRINFPLCRVLDL